MNLSQSNYCVSNGNKHSAMKSASSTLLEMKDDFMHKHESKLLSVLYSSSALTPLHANYLLFWQIHHEILTKVS